MRKRKLKIWNGRGHGKYTGGSIYVAAYSEKHARELIEKACAPCYLGTTEIRNYYSKGLWGKPMNGIEPTEPCVYASARYDDKPIRIL